MGGVWVWEDEVSRYPWFRVYNEILTERKIERIGRMTHLPRVVIRGAWMTILAMANDSPERGCLKWTDDLWISEAELCDDLEMAADEFTPLLDAFVRMQMVTRHEGGGLSCTNFDKRQFKSDNSTPRVQAWRDKQQPPETGERNVSETLLCNAPDTEAEAETDTDTEADTQQQTPPAAQPVDNSNGDGVVVALREELLAWQMLAPQAEQCIKRRTPGDIRAFLNYVEDHKDEIRNPAGFLYDALVKNPHPAPPPCANSPPATGSKEDRLRYVSGEYGDAIQH